LSEPPFDDFDKILKEIKPQIDDIDKFKKLAYGEF
jgi:hypothetical protein